MVVWDVEKNEGNTQGMKTKAIWMFYVSGDNMFIIYSNFLSHLLFGNYPRKNRIGYRIVVRWFSVVSSSSDAYIWTLNIWFLDSVAHFRPTHEGACQNLVVFCWLECVRRNEKDYVCRLKVLMHDDIQTDVHKKKKRFYLFYIPEK